MTALLLLALLGVTGFNAWLLLLTRRDLRALQRAHEKLAAPTPRPELSQPAPGPEPKPEPKPLASARTLPPAPPLSAGAEVADRFFRRVMDGALDDALDDAGESLSRDRLDDFHARHAAWANAVGVREVDDGDARAVVRYADADQSPDARFTVTSAFVGKRWVVIDLHAGAP